VTFLIVNVDHDAENVTLQLKLDAKNDKDKIVVKIGRKKAKERRRRKKGRMGERKKGRKEERKRKRRKNKKKKRGGRRKRAGDKEELEQFSTPSNLILKLM